MMANFDRDDPLGDLLSDGSDDSFFDEPKVLAKRPSISKTQEKKSVSDIFGLNEDKEINDDANSVKKNENDWLGLDKTLETSKTEMNVKSPIRSAKPIKKISFEEDDDILGSIGLGNKTELSATNKKTDDSFGTTKLESTKKTALLESLLGSPKLSSKNTSSFDDILGGKKETNLPKTPTTTASMSQSSFGFSSEVPREGRRSRPQTTTLHDPLGLFSSEPSKSIDNIQSKTQPKQTDTNISNKGAGDGGSTDVEVIFSSKPKNLITKSTPNITDLPDWLGGGSPVKTNKSESILKKETKVTPTDAQPKEAKKVIQEIPVEQKDSVPNSNYSTDSFAVESLIAQQKFATSNIGYQNTSMALQQQESQLLMALQIKKYEENMSEMQKQQQEILLKQEQQFSSLLERQFAKQQIMENNMRLQQERINNHIQLLISQPPISSAMKSDKAEEKLEDLQSTKSDENSRLYEEMIKNLKQHQHEEIFLLEESYKKQIAILEQTTESMEQRLKNEVTNITEAYENKIKTIYENHEEEISKYKQKMDELMSQHKEEVKLLRENHDRVIEEIKYEYSTMVENMKHMKQSEYHLFENSAKYANKLDDNLKILDVNSKALLDIHHKVENDYGVLSRAREESLKAKEEEIKLMRETLEKSREAAETERAQLLTLVRSLEIKIVEQTQNSREERWALQQAAATLAARSSALDRESEFNRSSIEREREQLKSLKETLLAEQEQMMLHLQEEKLAVSAEKSRMETSSKLNQNYDSQRAKAEVNAAIQVAKEAAELTDRERENLHQQQCEVESFKRNLLDRERKLAIKEKQLDGVMHNAEQRAKEGEKALIDARLLETKYNERLRDIQKQLLSLTNREKKLAEEKIALSKERLSLNTLKRQTRQCGLCAVDTVAKLDNDEHLEMNTVELDYPRIITAMDSDLMRIHLEITENEQNIFEGLEENFS